MTVDDGGEERLAVSPSGRSVFAERFRQQAANFWLALFFRLIAAAPSLARAPKPLFVRLAYAASGKIRINTASNAGGIFGNQTAHRQRRRFGLLVVGAFYDFACDVGQSLRMTREQLAGRIESVQGHDLYRAARSARKGAVIITAHMGSFEVGLVALSMAEPNQIHVVFKRDEVGAFERLRTELRRNLNVAEAAIDDGWPVWMRLREALLNDEVVAIQGDRVMPGQKGVRVNLFAGDVLLPTGPFKLAMAAGSPVIPIFSVRTAAGKIRIFIEEAIDPSSGPDGIHAAVRKFAVILEKYVAAHPDQWLVLDRAFCENAIAHKD